VDIEELYAAALQLAVFQRKKDSRKCLGPPATLQ
jgi:hypothetical protein